MDCGKTGRRTSGVTEVDENNNLCGLFGKTVRAGGASREVTAGHWHADKAGVNGVVTAFEGFKALKKRKAQLEKQEGQLMMQVVRSMEGALEAGDTEALEKFLKENRVDLDKRGRHRMSYLHYAVEGNCPRAVAFLLEQGANVDALNKHKRTPLEMAMIKGRPRVAEVLLSSGKIAKNPSKYIDSDLLNFVLEGGSIECCKLLLPYLINRARNQCSIDRADRIEWFFHFIKSVVLELGGQAAVNEVWEVDLEEDKFLLSALLVLSVRAGLFELVELFVNKGGGVIWVEQENCIRRSFKVRYHPTLWLASLKFIHCACAVGLRNKIANDLKQWGILDDRDPDKFTILYHATTLLDVAAVEFLLEAGADPKALIREGETIADIAERQAEYSEDERVKQINQLIQGL
tara:strand:+ start:44250 stop:45461 length:1212 start_codon:yes stop_codon:yes gene_type:complete